MKLETAGTLRRIDIDVLVELALALQNEWANFTFDDQIGAVSGSGYRRHTCSVLVAQGQMKQEILKTGDTIVSELGGEFGSHSAQLTN